MPVRAGREWRDGGGTGSGVQRHAGVTTAPGSLTGKYGQVSDRRERWTIAPMDCRRPKSGQQGVALAGRRAARPGSYRTGRSSLPGGRDRSAAFLPWFAGLRAGQRGLTAAWITTSGVISALMLTASNGGTAGHFTGTWPLPLAKRSAAKTQGVGHEQDSMTHRNVRWHGTSVRSCPSHGELAQIHWQASTRCYRPHQDLATRTEPSQVRRLPVAQI
jgi:hypothetical protein